jgi:hypothetical protein
MKLLTDKEIMMIVPNNVTFAQYHITEWQENVITLIGDKLQDHVTRKRELPRDIFNQPYVEIECDEAAGKNHKSMMKKEIVELRKKPFVFSWRHPDMNKDIETDGVIITTIHDIKGTNRLVLTLNIWAIPFLLYYGIGVGGTRYNKTIALSLRGNYTKRLYKMIMSQQDRAEYYYPLEKFRSDLQIPDNYTNGNIDQKILKPSQERIQNSGSDVWFEYEMFAKYPTAGRKPKADTIKFKIHTTNPQKAGGDQAIYYTKVYNWTKRAFGNPTNDSALNAVEKIAKTDRLKDVYERCIYYEERVARQEQTMTHVNNSFLKMLREEFKIEHDKRTPKSKAQTKKKQGQKGLSLLFEELTEEQKKKLEELKM